MSSIGKKPVENRQLKSAGYRRLIISSMKEAEISLVSVGSEEYEEARDHTFSTLMSSDSTFL